MAGGGHVIIRNRMRAVAELGTVQEQLGPLKQAKLLGILDKDDDDWTGAEARFVAKCILNAVESYEE